MRLKSITGSFVLLMAIFMMGCNKESSNKDKVKKNTESAFSELHRPQFHFTPASGWMNDPNGMVYHNGEYHLFYQHNPDSTVWGPMHWGHAISKDLVHWEHMPIALYPDEHGTIFSGSAVVDTKNTSGLGTNDNPPMVAIFTYHNHEGENAGRVDFQTQGIAFSLDNGRTWEKYENNPVLPNPGIRDFRDPKVMWHEESEKWVMSLAVADHISFYSSPNLLEWEFESDFGANIGGHGGVWECPDLFKLSVEGTAMEKWVLLVSINPGGPNGGSATQYFVGDFDGSSFKLEDSFKKELLAEPIVPEGKVFADFEGEDYKGWITEGEAFAKGPAKGTLKDQNKVSKFMGKGLVNSFYKGDGTTGKLTSPTFTIESDYINFLVGGGKHKGGTGVNLLINGKAVRTTTGTNSEALSWTSWETKDLKGKKATIEIFDNETEGWGHILVDHIMFSNKPAENAEDGIWLDYGTDNYAGVTWSNVPDQDGRRLFIGWMSNWNYANVVPTENWRSAMTVARTLSLAATEKGLRVLSSPVKEIEKLYGVSYAIEAQTVKDNLDISQNGPFQTATFELDLEMEAIGKSDFAIELSNDKNQKVLIGYKANEDKYYIDRSEAGNHAFSDSFGAIHFGPRVSSDNNFSIKLLVDVASVELFADDGKTVMTDIFFPDEKFTKIKLVVNEGQMKILSGKVNSLKSIWENTDK